MKHVLVVDKKYEFGIDARLLTNNEKQWLIRCDRFGSGDNVNYPQAEKYAKKLLKREPNSAIYHFLIAQIYYDWMIVDYTFPDKHPLYFSKFTHHLHKALHIEPNHPVFLIFFAKSHWGEMDGRLAISLFNNIYKLLQDHKYLLQYKHQLNTQKFELHFHWSYLINLQRIDDYNNLCNKLNKLYPRYIHIMHHSDDTLKYGQHTTSNRYAVWFQHQGKYNKAYEALKIQYCKNDYSSSAISQKTLDLHLSIYFVLNKCDEMQQFIQNILCNRTKFAKSTDSVSKDQLNGYLFYYSCLAAANMDTNSKVLLDMHKKYLEMKDLRKTENIEEASLFIDCCFCYVLIRHPYVVQKIERLYSVKELLLKFIVDIVTDSNKLQQLYDRPSGEKFWYILGRILHICILEPSIATLGIIDVSIGCFFRCLSAITERTNGYLDGDVFDHPDYFLLKPKIGILQPLSYLYAGLNAGFAKQYQVVVKLLKKSKVLGGDMILLDRLDELIIYSKTLWKQQRCSYCNSKNKTLKSCKGCMKKFYCDVFCQKMHWNSHHRNECEREWESRMYLINYKWS
eukprot:304644_1